ncbi:1-acylglycerol-3-phosphate acyltransferase [Lasallia pustulata]|uniref:1-acyl-sn-glycerol-3-phosphate acyltransferase n=1 Tax=Lasallia pustulata TaxID=136370 RepID=A0A1W5D8V1_9LECA|nr:1-acylglycerol-3-phosphate acyltransferase [Lasallia pustulata]
MHPLLLSPLLLLLLSLLAIPLLHLTSHLLRTRTPSFLARLLSSYLCLLLCATYGVLAALLLRLTSHHLSTQHTVARAFKYSMLLLTGVRFDVVAGGPHLATRPAVFIANHQSELDVLLLGAVFPPHCAVTAKKSLARVPFLGWFMRLSGTVFVDRADRARAVKAFDGAAGEMRRRGQSVFIFPEGTRSYVTEPGLLGFKKGAFHLAVQAQVEVVPVVAAVYAGVMSVRERRFEAGRIPVKVLAPISTKGLTSADVDDLARTTRDLMLRELQLLSQTPAGQAVQYPKQPASSSPQSRSANYKPAAEPRKVGLSNGNSALQAGGAATTSGADAGKVRDAL